MVIGIDVSLYDPILDWAYYTWDFAFIKGGQADYIDPKFKIQWQAARNNTVRGAYHFFKPYMDPVVAAEKFASFLGNDLGEIPPVLDLETADNIPDQVASRALTWLRRLEQLIGLRPIVYTSVFFANTIHISRYSEFQNYKLWLAQYPWDLITGTWSENQRNAKIESVIRNGTYAFPVPPAPFAKTTFAQWTAKCKPELVPGYPLGTKDAVDINFYNGDITNLFREFNIQFTPTPPGDEPMSDSPITLTADLIKDQPSNLRSAPGIVGTTILKLLTGPLTIQGIGQKIFKDGYYWIEIISPQHGFVALTTSYTNVNLNPTPPPVTDTRKIVSSLIRFSDGSVEELFPANE